MPTIRQPILVAVKLDHAAIALVRQAGSIARAQGVPLRIGHVLPELVLVHPLFPQLHVPELAGQSQLEATALDQLSDIATEALGESAEETELLLEHGTPQAGLRRMAESLRPGLIVIGAGDAGGKSSGVAGRIAQDTRCAVLIARRMTSGPIIAATDFSDPALPAVLAGRAEALRRERSLYVINCFDLFPVPPMTKHFVESLPRAYSEGLRSASRAKLDACAEAHAAKPLFREGHPSEVIMQAANELGADLVVVGTHGRSGVRRFALGSVAEDIMCAATCSVMVVPITDALQ